MARTARRANLDNYDELPRSMRRPRLVDPAAPSTGVGMFLGPKGTLIAGLALVAIVVIAFVIM